MEKVKPLQKDISLKIPRELRTEKYRRYINILLLFYYYYESFVFGFG